MIVLYNLCRWVNTPLLWLPIKLYRRDVGLIRSQFARGLNRTSVFTKGQVQYVQRHNPDGPTTFFALREDGKLKGAFESCYVMALLLTCVHHRTAMTQFNGIHTTEPKTKPIASFEYVTLVLISACSCA